MKKKPKATKVAKKITRKAQPNKAAVVKKVAKKAIKKVDKSLEKVIAPLKKEVAPVQLVLEPIKQPPVVEVVYKEPYVAEEPQYPERDSIFTLHITPELAPVAKVGGLADVVAGLSREIEIRGNHVEIILPKYDCMRYDHIWGLQLTYEGLMVPWYDDVIYCDVWFGFVHGRKCFFIDPKSHDNFFNRGSFYGFHDDVLRYAFFCRASLEFMLKTDKHPDVIHCHDWHTGLVPVLLYEMYKDLGMTHPRVCYTIHNFKHQGLTGDFVLHATGLNRPEYFLNQERLLDDFNPNAVNLMKGGIVYSNFTSTVSNRHAMEAKETDQGFGLNAALHVHQGKYGGVLNGIDYDVWNPEIDEFIPVKYGVDSVELKYQNKEALRDRLFLQKNDRPIIAYVGRLDSQKGLDLVLHTLYWAINNGAQFVLLGSSPSDDINAHFGRIKAELNENEDSHLEIGYDEELAHLIYAGADMILVPSKFEPCGLTQMIALKYGTIPIVRSVGGLADTIFDKDFAEDKSYEERNGYVFHEPDGAGVDSATSRAVSLWYDFPEDFRDLMIHGMHCDYSWKNPGENYLNIYDHIRER